MKKYLNIILSTSAFGSLIFIFLPIVHLIFACIFFILSMLYLIMYYKENLKKSWHMFFLLILTMVLGFLQLLDNNVILFFHILTGALFYLLLGLPTISYCVYALAKKNE